MAPGDDSDGDEMSFEYLPDEGTPVSTAIVQTLCAIENVDPVDAPEELGVTLHDHVDPEALDTVVTTGSSDEDVRVTFTIDTYRISVTDSGRIRVRLLE